MNVDEVNKIFHGVKSLNACGGFLTSFVQSWFNADDLNKLILLDAATQLIFKYKLEKDLQLAKDMDLL